MTNTFLFYDIETSGLNKTFDQVLQFAAIRTDLKLNIIQQHDILIKLSIDTLLDPQALLVHKLGPNFCKSGIDEYKAIHEIHELMNTPGTISLGYNTLGFDDEFLRFKFHQHLLPPYTHQYANNCFRADLYPMLIMYYLFKPEIIKWPITRSMKLEDLNQANNFTQGRSHTALADVEATIGLAKNMLVENDLWQYLLGYFNKNEDQKRLTKLAKHTNNYQAGILINGAFGWDKKFSTPVYYLGRHQHYKNQTIWLNLDNNFQPQQLQQNHLVSSHLIIRKKDAEPGFIVPINRACKLWDEEFNQQLAINLTWCNNNPAILKPIADHYTTQTYPLIENCDPAADLYQAGFPDNRTLEQLGEFWQQSNWQDKADFFACLPKNKRALAERLIWRYDPKKIPNISIYLKDYLQSILGTKDKLLDYKQQSFRNLPEIKQSIEALLKLNKVSLDERKLLLDYKSWLDKNWRCLENNML